MIVVCEGVELMSREFVWDNPFSSNDSLSRKHAYQGPVNPDEIPMADEQWHGSVLMRHESNEFLEESEEPNGKIDKGMIDGRGDEPTEESLSTTLEGDWEDNRLATTEIYRVNTQNPSIFGRVKEAPKHGGGGGVCECYCPCLDKSEQAEDYYDDEITVYSESSTTPESSTDIIEVTEEIIILEEEGSGSGEIIEDVVTTPWNDTGSGEIIEDVVTAVWNDSGSGDSQVNVDEEWKEEEGVIILEPGSGDVPPTMSLLRDSDEFELTNEISVFPPLPEESQYEPPTSSFPTSQPTLPVFSNVTCQCPDLSTNPSLGVHSRYLIEFPPNQLGGNLCVFSVCSCALLVRTSIALLFA